MVKLLSKDDGWTAEQSSPWGPAVALQPKQMQCGYRMGQAAEYRLFAWMSVGFKGSLEVRQVRVGELCHGAQQIYDGTA